MEIIHGFMNRNNSNSSKVWVLSGNDGKPVSGWPFRVGNSHNALPLVTQLDGKGALDFVRTHFPFLDRQCSYIQLHNEVSYILTQGHLRLFAFSLQ